MSNRNQIIKDVVFGILSLIILATICYVYFDRVVEIQLFRFAAPVRIYQQVEHHSCHITITEPTIILRMDDVRAYSSSTVQLVDSVLKKNMSITLGVIPYKLDRDLKIVRYLQKTAQNPLVEIAQHGYYHNQSDIVISDDLLLLGNAELQQTLGVVPITYIPPYNKLSDDSLAAVSNHFKVISASFNILKEGNIAQIGQTIETFYYNKNITNSVQDIKNACANNLKQYNYCVVTIHPQEFKYSEDFKRYEEILTALDSLDASFKTFKDVVYCAD